MDEKYKINSYFQTTVRNVGIYTSISFASLGYFRAHRNKDKIINTMMILIGIMFTILALLFTTYLLDDINTITEDGVERDYINKWIIIPQIMYVLNIILLIISISMLFLIIIK
jgi:hypothetical protein